MTATLGIPPGARCSVHPEQPAAAACSNCGTFGCIDCIGILGGRQICRTCVEDGRVEVYGVPWDNRSELGLAKAWALTMRELLLRPVEFFKALDPKTPIADAALFAAVSVGSVVLLALVLSALACGIFGIFMGVVTENPAIGAAVAIGGTLYATALGSAGACTAAMMMLPHHLILIILGGGKNGFGATARVALFSFGLYPGMVIPFLNNVVFIWMLVLQAIGYKHIHQDRGWQAIVAVALPMLFCCISYIGSYAAIILLDSL